MSRRATGKRRRRSPDVMQFGNLSLLAQCVWNSIAAVEAAARQPYSDAATVKAGRELTWLQSQDDSAPWASFAEACDWLHIAPSPFLKHLRPVFQVIDQRKNGNRQAALRPDYAPIAVEDNDEYAAQQQRPAALRTRSAAGKQCPDRPALEARARAHTAATAGAAVKVTPARELVCTCEHHRTHEHAQWRCPRHGAIKLTEADNGYNRFLKNIKPKQSEKQ